jgi:hypothetical protein
MHSVAEKFEARDITYNMEPGYRSQKTTEKLYLGTTGILASAVNADGQQYIVVPKIGFVGEDLSGFYQFIKFILEYEELKPVWVTWSDWKTGKTEYLDKIIR